MEVRERGSDIAAMGAGAIAVGFSPAQPLAALARYLQWPWPFLSDPELLVYRRLRVPRVGWRAVYTPTTMVRYATALLHRERVHRPVEDTRQLGADAIVVGGHAVQVFRSRSPDTRAPVDALLDALRAEGASG